MQYRAPLFLFNGHLETIYPSLFRTVAIGYTRERITTWDDDFLDLDWLKQNSKKLVVISHGLEGNSSRPYVTGMAGAFFAQGYDVLAWNYRGCGEEINRQLRFYHSGATDDLDFIIQHALSLGVYHEINLIGFSLGGNLTLKYLGENHLSAKKISKAVVFSVPLDLHSSCIQLSRSSNWIYSQRFLKSLKNKVKQKALLYSELKSEKLSEIKTLIAFDDTFTAPLHGFKNAEDYYSKCSALYFLKNISRPVLIVNALNDPFLSPICFPSESVINNSLVKLETTLRGGHCGFAQFNGNGVYWSEQRALAFLQQND